MNITPAEITPDIHFMRITVTTMNQICDLSKTLSPAHRKMVADNVRSIAEAHFSESVWMRAIYADETPIGFIMTHTGSDYEDGIDCPGVFLWRFMIAGPTRAICSPGLTVRLMFRSTSRSQPG